MNGCVCTAVPCVSTRVILTWAKETVEPPEHVLQRGYQAKSSVVGGLFMPQILTVLSDIYAATTFKCCLTCATWIAAASSNSASIDHNQQHGFF